MSACVVCLRDTERGFECVDCEASQALLPVHTEWSGLVAWAAQRAREFEREACAAIADDVTATYERSRLGADTLVDRVAAHHLALPARRVAAAIRARSKT